jgi:NADPH-dependent glutamate synthase beta subunit-like oxidoreductase
MSQCKPFALDLAADQSGLPHYQPPPCQVACPVGTDVASYVGLIWQGDLGGALEAITATNPFSSVCGRVCDAPCEPACRRADADGAVAIRTLKRYVMERLGPGYRLPPVSATKDKRVAIVGAGPAGMTAAQDIAAAGYGVDVYEAQAKAGGMMAWGIPAFRLPRETVEEDISRILARCPGITLHLSSPLGGAVTLDELAASHDAVLLTVGASAGKLLGVPGGSLPQVQDGVQFLKGIASGKRPAMPEEVVVVGGGDVAMDACRTALRLPGVKHVKVIYRRGPDEIPARKYEIAAAVAEGVEIVYNLQPTSIQTGTGGGVTLRCLQTCLGEPGADGRRSFAPVPGSEFEITAGMVIAAVGQKTADAELARHGLLEGDRIATDPATMRTPMHNVFAAGDAATGSSTIVQAMYQGHRAAYYVLAALEHDAHPVPYRTPLRTRGVPVAQDPEWEKLAPEEGLFLGVGKDPFADADRGYGDAEAHRQAARCYRCDTETGSSDYTAKARESIFALARLGAGPAEFAAITAERMKARPDPFPVGRAATFDELVFLPANLTRLVIDPYRESCKTATAFGRGLSLAIPLLAGGFDRVPETVRKALAGALAASGTAYIGRRAPASADVPWLQLLDAGGEGDPNAAALLAPLALNGGAALPVAARPGQLRGLVATAATMERVVGFAIEHGADLLMLDGTGHAGADWAELSGVPDLSLLRRTVELMRARNAEEAMPILWYGGLRSGSDLAKAMALGANGGMISVAAALAMGGAVAAEGIAFGDLDSEQAAAALASFLQATVAECSMMARCTGKTSVHNLEPEDLRSISLAAQRVTGIGMAGVRRMA